MTKGYVSPEGSFTFRKESVTAQKRRYLLKDRYIAEKQTENNYRFIRRDENSVVFDSRTESKLTSRQNQVKASAMIRQSRQVASRKAAGNRSSDRKKAE
jgi:hypothetical protein